MDDINRIKPKLKPGKKSVIISHSRPDGDAIGSSLALKMFLDSLGMENKVLVPNDYANFLKWLKGSDQILNFELDQKQCIDSINGCDLLFNLDYNDPKRAGGMSDLITNSNAVKVLIDHHLDPLDFTDLSFSNQKASSTAELVFEFIYNIDKDYNLTKPQAEAIYVGMVTDTGKFQFSSTTPRVHEIVAKLLEAGVEPDQIQNKVFNSFSENRLRFFSFCVSEKMKIFANGEVAYIPVTTKEMHKYNIGVGDTEGLVNYPLLIDKVKAVVLMKEDGNIVKLSFRSKDKIDVASFARSEFSGGGHLNAAGGVHKGSLEDCIEKFITSFAPYFEKLK